ncbi:MAG TPA: hypothetical protein VE890_18435 [Thermoguttaceae bacterium]|nr:hypothetical protein [Thermoguttaceae bacterium]
MEPTEKKPPQPKPPTASNRRLRFDAPSRHPVRRPYFLQRKDRPDGQ